MVGLDPTIHALLHSFTLLPVPATMAGQNVPAKHKRFDLPPSLIQIALEVYQNRLLLVR
jgi:hypothetical protein